MRLFVSFAHVDEVCVAELAATMAAAGFEAWWDDRLDPGDDWKAELMRQIAACDAFLYVVSTDSSESSWCRWELDQAAALSKFIVPVIIRTGATLPLSIAGLQYVDASAGVGAPDIARLVERLARLRQTAVAGDSVASRNPRGFPARFTRPLPKSYRTVSQAYLRPAAPNTYPFQWPELSGDGERGGRIVGIDFGTSTSAVALHLAGRNTLIPNDVGETSTPSAVAIAQDGRPLVGQRAVEFLVRRPERGVLEVKRLFGREMARELGGQPVLEVDGISYRAIDLAGFILARLRADSEAHLGAPVRRAVLTAPAYFDQTQHVALIQAAGLAGLEVMRVISEPVAACLGANKFGSNRDSLTLVYDLGGGTFDASVLECSEGVCEVKAVSGDTHLGGADFDREVVDYCVGDFKDTTAVDLRGDATALMRLRNEVERAKIELSSIREVRVSVPFIAFGPSGPIDLSVDLSRARYNELTHALVARTVALTRSVLDDAATELAAVDDVIIVGRAARAASVQVALHDLFGRRARAASDHVVALGAAVQAGVLEGLVKDVLLLDTVAHTLRVQVAGRRAVPVIARNSTIPAIGTMRLAGQRSDHRTTLVRILAGESSWPDRNIPLIECELPSGTQHGQSALTLELDIDANSMLWIGVRGEGGTTERKASLGLRSSAIELADLVEVAPENEPRLPVYSEGPWLRPLPEAAFADVAKVCRWLTDATTNLVLSAADRRTLGLQHEPDLQRARKVQEWLRTSPDKDVSLDDAAEWRPFTCFDIERELLVDMLEQRVGIELRTLRYCHSIASMSERFVVSVRG